MDSSNIGLAALNRKRKANFFVKNAFIRTQFYQSCHPQDWSFPDSMIFYITQNPSTPKRYQKMIQTCKYFFSKNPIIICEKLIYDIEDNQLWIKQDSVFKKPRLINHLLWITHEINIDPEDNEENEDKEDVASSIIPKIYQCDVKCLYLWHQNISLNEYIILASNAKNVLLCDTVVKNDDDTVAALEKLVQHTGNASHFNFSLNHGNDISISSETVKNLLLIPHFSFINLLSLDEVSEFFDIETFFTYIKKNKYTDIKIWFSKYITKEYKKRIEVIIDEILATQNHDYKLPYLSFPGRDNEKFMKLRECLNLKK